MNYAKFKIVFLTSKKGLGFDKIIFFKLSTKAFFCSSNRISQK
jgi:hypothetical protein